jgi:hypothetical protein
MTANGNRRRRQMAIVLLIVFLQNIFMPSITFALSGGPSQPEVQSFEPIGTSQMVDLASGSFTYNIPLMEVDGYPLNLFYHSGVGMDQEASSTGLGWNINPGVIGRSLRGLPDDFKEDEIVKEMNIKANTTVGVSTGVELELFGYDAGKLALSVSVGGYYNNYRGLGYEFGISPSLRCESNLIKDKMALGLGSSLNFNFNSQEGVTTNLSVSPSMSFNKKIQKTDSKLSCGIMGGIGTNSRTGLMAATITPFVKGEANYKPATRKYENATNLSSGSAIFSFAVPSYLPSIDMPLTSAGISLRAALGAEVFGIHAGTMFSGYYSTQYLTTKRLVTGSMGTMYLHYALDDNHLLDFNREKDGAFTPFTPNLPLVVPTQDIYSVSGQGIGGSYLLKRGDIGVFRDKYTSTTSGQVNRSVEIGALNAFHGGADVVGIGNSATVSGWKGNNGLYQIFDFMSKSDLSSIPEFEPAYFKQAGEISVESDGSLFNELGGFDPISAVIDKGEKFNMGIDDEILVKGVNNTNLPLPTEPRGYRQKREKRNQNITYATAADAMYTGLNNEVEIYNQYTNQNCYTLLEPSSESRVTTIRKPHHVSEISVNSPDGKRYIYGLPAYNTKQQEYTFAVDPGNYKDTVNGLVYYSNKEASIKNESGSDHFYTMEETPAYSHSFLLTSVLSSDYVDSDSKKGPSEHDAGNYTLIKYNRSHTNYKWRTPMVHNTDQYANFNEGRYSSNMDDKASFVYGEKENWYVNSVEGKEQIAQFFYSDRKDGLPVTSVTGKTFDLENPLLKLDSIRLMSKADLRSNGVKSIPVITVVMTYSYKLCRGIPNSSGYGGTDNGKLTLDTLYFLYGNSRKGKLSPYVFDYGKGGLYNPNYNSKNISRWGGYQLNPAIMNTLYPYVRQDKSEQDLNAYAWNLTKISLPTGGAIEVDYESNDYAFVQDKPAMEMIKIAGFGNGPSYSGSSVLFGSGSNDNNNFVYFPLKSNCTHEELMKYYIKDIVGKFLYFKCKVKILSNAEDMVTGYAKVKSAGICTNSPPNFQYGYLELEPAKRSESGNQKIQPIAKAGWQFIKLHDRQLVYNELPSTGSTANTNVFISMVKTIMESVNTMSEFLKGQNDFMHSHGIAKELNLDYSWIRLYNPDGRKLAGGSRVKRIVISDNFDVMTSDTVPGTKYGQEFDYTRIESVGGTEYQRVISSGVASYEPLLGCDENPFRQPEFYEEEHCLAPDERFYQEYPMGESYFPSPQIVYSKVTVRNLKFDSEGALTSEKFTTSGYSVNEYYTASDFPTITKRTELDKEQQKQSPILTILKITNKDHMAATQGFSVETNNMHGQAKSQWVYNNQNQAISGVEYFYKTNGNTLSNTVKVINERGEVSNELIGIDYQISTDARQASTDVTSAGLALNMDGFLAAIFPFCAFVPLPVWEKEQTRFRSMVIVKHVQRTGILEKTVAYDASSKISTKNLAFDSETGEVLLTSTQNEFNDSVFNFKYPAHFMYPGMRQAYLNTGIEAIGTLQTNYQFTIAHKPGDVIQYFYPGDEVLLSGSISPTYAWVVGVNPDQGYILLCDKNGKKINTTIGVIDNVSIKIVRSGHRNMQTMEAGSITLKANPIVGNVLNFADNQIASTVLNASATSFSDKWQYDCTVKPDQIVIGGADRLIYNPFLSGVAGNWRPSKTLSYLEDRNSNIANFQKSIISRSFGTITNFIPYWSVINNEWQSSISPEWQWTEKITKFNRNGIGVEVTDPLSRYSSNQTSVRGSKVTASLQNARYNEAVYLNFENATFNDEINAGIEYTACRCQVNPKYYYSFNSGIDTTYSHTGRSSLKVLSGTDSLTIACQLVDQYPYYTSCQNQTSDEVNQFPLKPEPYPTLVDSCRFLDPTHFQEEKDYLISGWVKIGDNLNTVLSQNSEPKIRVTLETISYSLVANYDAVPSGISIDGWRKVETVFRIPATPNVHFITLKFFTANNYTTYLDDLRIQPFDASMKCYIYDQKTQKLKAELDENNYATFYEYDKSGALERVKKETEKGVMTIKEVRMNQKKN